MSSWAGFESTQNSSVLKYLVPVTAAAVSTGALIYSNRRWLLCTLYDYVARGRQNPGAVYLEGAFAPVRDELTDECPVIEGALPEELQGAYIRTGPNPALDPVGGYHWFDGDGHLHTLRIKGGKAFYANRYVETFRLQQERAAGRPLFLKMGDIWGKEGLLLLMLSKLKKTMKVYDDSEGGGTGNTALVYHARRLLALNEGDLPYQLRVLCNGVVETLGRLKIKDANAPYPGPFTAHPKIDPKTGEMFFFGYTFDKKPYVRAGLMSAAGEVLKQWAVDVPWPVMAHDCALTKNYAVLLHLPLVFSGEAMIKNNTVPLVFDDTKPAMLGLLRRDAPGCECDVTDPEAKPVEVQWFKLPAFYAFHVANAWEDAQGRVHLVLCSFNRFNFGFNDKDRHETPEEEKQRPVEYVMDPATGQAIQRQLSDVYCDFPVVNPSYACHPTQYMYGATWHYGAMTVEADGIAKYDMTVPEGQDACVARIRFPKGCYGGEAFFQPRYDDPAKCDGEDDGWLLVYVYNTANHTSVFQVYDAKTMDNKPVATVQLPRRVPYGFHTTFVTEQQLVAQRTTL